MQCVIANAWQEISGNNHNLIKNFNRGKLKGMPEGQNSFPLATSAMEHVGTRSDYSREISKRSCHNWLKKEIGRWKTAYSKISSIFLLHA